MSSMDVKHVCLNFLTTRGHRNIGRVGNVLRFIFLKSRMYDYKENYRDPSIWATLSPQALNFYLEALACWANHSLSLHK